MKYSIIIPVYNAEQHLNKCLDSVLNQTYDDYEVIIVNDGSTDKSEGIIKSYIKKYNDRIKYFYKENRGVSHTRNFGVSKANGDYFTFVDSDDYISNDLLKEIDAIDNYDVLSFNLVEVKQSNEIIKKIVKPSFKNINGQDAIVKMIDSKNYFDTPVAYVYKKAYWEQHQFKYEAGRYHEDFGLTPLVILYAPMVVSIDFVGYFYVQSDNSIMRSNNKEKNKKKAYDMLHHFDNLYYTVNKDLTINNNTKTIFNSYISNAVILKAGELDPIYLKDYIIELNKRKVRQLILSNNLKHKVKKLISYFSIKIYIKLFS